MQNPETKTEVFVGTHDGEFHPDEVFAIATLMTAKMDRPESLDVPEITVVRSRDKDILDSCDILIDVGKEYIPEEGKFDHHQKGGAGERPNGMPYASFGLIWKEYGLTVCDGNRVQADFVDDNFVQLIDAYDNGRQLFEPVQDEDLPGISDFKPGQDIFNCNALPGRTEEEKFDRALAVASILLEGRVSHAGVVCDSVEAIKRAISESERADIIKLPIVGTSWQETLPVLSEDALFVIQEEEGLFTVRAVPRTPNGSTRSILFPEGWGGIEDPEKLREETGVEGVTFIHAERFYAKAITEASAMQLADKAVELARAA